MYLYRLLFVLTLGFCTCFLLACGNSLIYRPDIAQGNILDEDDIALLEAGMSRDEVRAVAGSPLADNVFREDDWYYLQSIHPGDGEWHTRLIVLHFKGDVLSHISGKVVPRHLEPDVGESQQRVVRVPDAPKTGIFGRLLGGKKPSLQDFPTTVPEQSDESEIPDEEETQ